MTLQRDQKCEVLDQLDIRSDVVQAKLDQTNRLVDKSNASQSKVIEPDPNDPNRFYYRSDHYNFAKKNIPSIFYFSGVHEDYHKHTDTTEKLIYEKVEKTARLIFYTAWELSNSKERPRVNQVNEFKL